MKTILAILTITMTVFLATALAGNPNKDELKVIYNLSGNLQNLADKELVVTFSDDMLPLGGKRAGSAIVQITPSIKGEFTWRGNRTLAFKPETRFRYSTTYTAVIPAGTRSLSGKFLPRTLRWQWSTPQAFPVEIKPAARSYFSDLNAGEKLNFQVWVKDAFTLRFNQEVAAGSAKEFFILKEAKSGKQVTIQVSQQTAEELKISYARDLERGMLYQFIIKRGFCGSEGSTGTGKEFTFSFDTVPDFNYTGTRPLVLYPDSPYCQLPFANRLAEADPALIKIFKSVGQDKIPLTFRLQSRHYENHTLFIRVDDELASDDRLSIRIDRKLTNIYNERLPEGLEIEAAVCSSRSPRLDFSMQNKKLAMTAKSMKQASVRLLKLKPEFYTQLTNRDFGMLQRRDFKAEFVEKEILQKLTDLPEKSNNPALKGNELGSPLGFFAFLVQRYEPYNSCRDIALMRLPMARPDELQVFHRRNMDMVVKAGQGQTLYWLYDNRSGKGLGKIPFFLKGYGQEAQPLGESSAEGVLLSSREIQKTDLITAKNTDAGDMALAKIDRRPPSDREVRITLFSERDFYKPGDTVHIGGIVKEYASGKVSSPKATSVSLEIRGPDWQRIKTDTLQLDPLGGFHYDYNSDPAGKKGHYQILVKVAGMQTWQAQHGVTIDYYQPNTFELKISGVAERYLPEDTFRPLVSGSYLAGNPMAGDAFDYMLGLAPNDSKVFTANGLERFSFGLDRDLAKSDPPQKGGDKFDARGKHTLAIPMSKLKKTNFLAKLGFSATGKSAEGKEFTARAQSLFFPGKLLTGIHIGYYQNLKEQVNAKLALVDFQGKPVSGEVRVTLYRQYYEKSRRLQKKVSGPDDVFIEKTKTRAFRVPEAGHYILRCDTPDVNGRVVSTSASFFSWGGGYSEGTDRLRIESNQPTLRNGEMLKCFIHSTREGQALVTVERGKVLDSRVIELQKMTPLEIPVKKEFFPGFRVSVVAMYENNVSEEASREFMVEDSRKTLDIGLECPAEIKPAGKTTLKIRVRNAEKTGVKAKLFVYAVDEGNLSLQGYRTPDPIRLFYHSSLSRRNAIQTYYSKNYMHWTFERPMMDIDLKEPAIFGCIFRPDATPLAGASVTLEDEKHNKLKTTTTSAQGYYSFPGLPGGRYAIKAEAKGFHPFLKSDIYFNGNYHRPCDLALIPVSADKYWNSADEFGVEGGVAGRAMPAPMAAEMKSMSRQKGEKDAEGGVIGGVLGGVPVDIAGIRVRSDFREVLFFKNIETDARGNAEIEFESSDQLSTFRIMAVAYGEDSFGSAAKKIMVSKDLLISEAMPEFARRGDEFLAGVQLSNRTTQKLPVTLLAKPEGISINGNPQIARALDARGNSLFQFPFLADRLGEAKIDFYAVSRADKDGLQKKLPVTDRLVMETLIDFASGKFLKKMIEPQAEAENQVITIKAAPSLLRPAVNIAKKLVFYPYECMEQRASKVMPFLAFSPQLAERLELGLDQGQVLEAVNGYLKIIPEFMNSQGALSYYRGGQYTSDYLTAYVLWSLHLARERDYMVDPQLVQKLSAYLRRASLDKTCESFYQFVLSLSRSADSKKLKKLAAERDTLPLPARVFLYRALNNQGKAADLLAAMLAEFNSSLQVEADFAYFDAGEFAYHRDFPFYSSRFATALLLQAVLEVEAGHVLAERIIRWLLEAEPYCWNTTQTNFWVMCAMDQYLAKVEKTTARKAEIVFLGEKTAKEFTDYQDMLSVSKKLSGRKEMVEVSVKADQSVYVTSELTYQLARAKKKSRGIDIQRLVYNETGQAVDQFKRGQVYQVELLLRTDKEVPYGVIDEPLAAGFELLRQDIGSTRSLKEFNTANQVKYRTPWMRRENAADRLVFYTYSMLGNLRIVYYIKAMYSGRFTWMPAIAQGMYHPQYFGRNEMKTVAVSD
ncbi:MAG: Ig-like domain-containing protein [Chrysiogenia bacterium]